MNANELADKLDDIPVNDFESLDQHHYTRESATMLRQQQEQINNLKQWEKRQLDVIEALKQMIDANNLSQNIGQFVQPANEPVAYRYEDKSNPLVFYFTTRKDEINNPDAIEIPLYTHPAKEPTVDEVMAEHCTCYKLGYSPLNDYAKVKQK